jgi:hypothetical protein
MFLIEKNRKDFDNESLKLVCCGNGKRAWECKAHHLSLKVAYPYQTS